MASVLGAEALAGAVPDLFLNDIDEYGFGSILSRGFALGEDMVRFKTRDTQQLEPSSARGLAQLLITTRLRSRAAAIRSGDEPPVLPSAQPEPDCRVQRNVSEAIA